MEEPDFELPAATGAIARLRLPPRADPWFIRVGGTEVYITVAAPTRAADDGEVLVIAELLGNAEVAYFNSAVDVLGPEGHRR